MLYNLLVLGCITDSHGQVWLRSPMDLYLVETMPLLDQKDLQVKILLDNENSPTLFALEFDITEV